MRDVWTVLKIALVSAARLIALLHRLYVWAVVWALLSAGIYAVLTNVAGWRQPGDPAAAASALLAVLALALLRGGVRRRPRLARTEKGPFCGRRKPGGAAVCRHCRREIHWFR